VDAFGDAGVPLTKLVDWLDAHPQVRALNSAVRQKALDEA
jgi:hypothetical protein